MKEGQNNTPSHTHVVANLIQQCADLTNNAKLNVVCAVCVLHAIVVVGSVSVSVDGVWCVCVGRGLVHELCHPPNVVVVCICASSVWSGAHSVRIRVRGHAYVQIE